MNAIFVASQIGNAYRGEVLDGKTYQTVMRTSHTYQNETIAKVAARRTWEMHMDKVGEQFIKALQS